MAWLGGLLRKVVLWLGPELVRLVVGYFRAMLEAARVKRESERKAREAREASEAAKTKEERDAAASGTQQNW